MSQLTPLGVYLRGVLMGAADIVPGVSGGTIAFITGIYDTLLGSIRAFDLELLAQLWKLDIKGAWQHVNGGFLLALLAGIGTSIFSLARLFSWILATHPVPLWAFFFGLILASAVVLLRQLEGWTLARVLCLLAGAIAAGAIAFLPVANLDFGLPGVFLAGFVAICAMILPGISGSFILVLLGMYGTVLDCGQSVGSRLPAGLLPGLRHGPDLFFAPPALAAAPLSPGDHGFADRLPGRFTGDRVALETGAGLGSGQPRRAEARATGAGIPGGISCPDGSGPDYLAVPWPDAAGLRRGMADRAQLGTRLVPVPGCRTGPLRPFYKLLLRIVGILLLCGLTGCGSSSHTPYTPAQPVVTVYVVQRGDTLYSIAFRYGLDYRKVAQVNNIVDPFTIYPGQNIYLWQVQPPLAGAAPAPDPAGYAAPVAPR